MSELLRQRLQSTPEMLANWSDETLIGLAIAFESALARAQAKQGIIDESAADAIGATCAAIDIDPAELAEEAASNEIVDSLSTSSVIAVIVRGLG